jgi:hypothetical protein
MKCKCQSSAWVFIVTMARSTIIQAFLPTSATFDGMRSREFDKAALFLKVTGLGRRDPFFGHVALSARKKVVHTRRCWGLTEDKAHQTPFSGSGLVVVGQPAMIGAPTNDARPVDLLLARGFCCYLSPKSAGLPVAAQVQRSDSSLTCLNCGISTTRKRLEVWLIRKSGWAVLPHKGFNTEERAGKANTFSFVVAERG